MEEEKEGGGVTGFGVGAPPLLGFCWAPRTPPTLPVCWHVPDSLHWRGAGGCLRCLPCVCPAANPQSKAMDELITKVEVTKGVLMSSRGGLAGMEALSRGPPGARGGPPGMGPTGAGAGAGASGRGVSSSHGPPPPPARGVAESYATTSGRLQKTRKLGGGCGAPAKDRGGEVGGTHAWTPGGGGVW
jgi:hypothetical protein